MRKWIVLIALLAQPLLLAQEARYFPQIGDGVLDGLQVRTTLLLVNTGPPTTVTVEFFDSAGEPMSLNAGGLSASTREIALAGGAGMSLETAGQGNAQESLALGYARLQAPATVEASAIFSISDQAAGTLLVEAAVAAAAPLENFTVFFDSRGPLDTGLAVVSAGGPGGTFNLTLRDDQSQVLAQRQVEIASGERIAAFVTELLSEAEVPGIEEMRGSVTVESQAGPLAAVTLRQINAADFPAGVPALTTFPVIPETVASLP